jgi:hypothetical protein
MVCPTKTGTWDAISGFHVMARTEQSGFDLVQDLGMGSVRFLLL